jgi:uncharacterized MAPEG superfamily protein
MVVKAMVFTAELEEWPMTSDLWALVATIALAMAQLSASSIVSLRQLGGDWILSPRDQHREAVGLAGRVVRAHRNLLEIFPQFAAALFVVHAANATGPAVSFGAWLFFTARLLYAPAYVFAPAGVRPLCWMAAQVGIVVILAGLLA